MGGTEQGLAETVAVVGALGTQGCSVIRAIRSAPGTAHWNIRALTSSPDSASAQELSKQANITIAFCDVNNVESIRTAFEGCTHIFANTAFHGSTLINKGQQAAEKLEHDHGINLMRAAAETKTLKHLVWSTLMDCNIISKGKWNIPHFMSKQGANAYILGGYTGYQGQMHHEDPGWGSLQDKTTLMAIGLYGSNFVNHTYRPILKSNGNDYVVQLPCSPQAIIPLAGDENQNVGIFVRAIFEQPNKSLGTWIACEAERLLCEQWVSTLDVAARSQGVKASVTFEECSMQSIEDKWGTLGNEIGQMMAYCGEYQDRAFSNSSGLPEINASDLGIETELVPTREFYENLDCVGLLREVNNGEKHMGTASR